MTRAEWRSAHRNARLGRRDTSATWPEHEWSSASLGHHHGVRHPAAWGLTVAALIAATIAVWRIAPGERRDQTLAVSVPAASTPAAAEGAY